MKKTIVCLLLLTMLLGLSACKQEAELRYEQDAAYYEEAEAQETMELQFANTVQAGSVIRLLDGETEVFSVTADSALNSLTIRSAALKKNVPYTLTVDGKVQQHSSFPQPPSTGVIPTPEQPSVPMEPMSLPTESSLPEGFTPGAGTGSEGRPGGRQPEMVPPESMGGELPSEGFGGKEPPAGGFLAERSAVTFMLTTQNNRFTGICDAVQSEGKEPMQ